MADKDCGGGQQGGRTKIVAEDNEGTQDWVADFNREGRTVASNAGDSGVAMMAVIVEDGGGR